MVTRVEANGNQDWGYVFLEYQEKEYQFPYYIATGEVFNDDLKSLIRFKCCVLTGVTPFVSIMRSIYWLAKAIFLALSEVYHYLDGQDPSEEAQAAMVNYAYDSVRALGYGALMTGSALMGIVNPYQGRLYYRWLERKLNHHTDGPHRDRFYFAICCQRLSILSKEENNLAQVEKKLESHVKWMKEIQAEVWNSLEQLGKNLWLNCQG